jgi:Crp-like helix-turn-helix domain
MSWEGFSAGPDQRPANNLLRHLSEGDFALIAPHLEYGRLASSEILYNPGDDVNIVYFPCGTSLASHVVSIEDGREVDAILVGCEGAVGGIVGRNYLPAYSRAVVKFGGPFVRLSAEKLEAAKLRSPSLREAFMRYATCLLAQLLQSTACNAVHSIEQRAAKWISSTMERIGGNLVPLTHEQLATMLGVGRSYASRVILVLKEEGIVETRRGAILVRNRAALHRRSCRCDASVAAHFDDVLNGIHPR